MSALWPSLRGRGKRLPGSFSPPERINQFDTLKSRLKAVTFAVWPMDAPWAKR
ncbi:MAG: hypothetical protein AAFQ10_10180 [Pseudomonadota bacterium]